MKIPFDIKYRPQIESGEYKVVTRKGETVRIERWDGKDDANPIDAFIWHNDEWNGPWHWHSNGLYKTAKSEDDFDLFLVITEPELTEFEQEIKDLISDARHLTDIQCDGSQKFVSDDDLRKTYAKTLLELAKKEICKGCTVGLDQYWKGRDDERGAQDKSKTFHYDTYQPPCFHGGICTNPMRDCINCPMHSSGTTTNTTSGTCKKD